MQELFSKAFEDGAATNADLDRQVIEIDAAREAYGGRALIVQRASDIVPEKIEWLWPGRVAVGKLSLLVGQPGLGKSQTAIFLAATITTGGRWPCDEGRAQRGSVIILSAEDGKADTVRPRLDAARADANRVFIVSAVRKDDGDGRRTFNLKLDLDLLEREIGRIADVRLIIVDPVSSYMGGADSHNNAETREVLEPIAEMADRLRVAVVAISHFSKNGAAKALDRVIGSIAFAAAARSAYTVVEDAEDESRRLFLEPQK